MSGDPDGVSRDYRDVMYYTIECTVPLSMHTRGHITLFPLLMIIFGDNYSVLY